MRWKWMGLRCRIGGLGRSGGLEGMRGGLRKEIWDVKDIGGVVSSVRSTHANWTHSFVRYRRMLNSPL